MLGAKESFVIKSIEFRKLGTALAAFAFIAAGCSAGGANTAPVATTLPTATTAAATPIAPPVTHLLYLHGFRSSPRSFKAQRMAQWLQANAPAVHWWCPQLPPSPRAAMALVRQGIEAWPAASSAVLGSSLGGFYATAVAQATFWNVSRSRAALF